MLKFDAMRSREYVKITEKAKYVTLILIYLTNILE